MCGCVCVCVLGGGSFKIMGCDVSAFCWGPAASMRSVRPCVH